MPASDYIHDRLGISLLADAPTLRAFRPVYTMLRSLTLCIQFPVFLFVEGQALLADRLLALDRSTVLVAARDMTDSAMLFGGLAVLVKWVSQGDLLCTGTRLYRIIRAIRQIPFPLYSGHGSASLTATYLLEVQ